MNPGERQSRSMKRQKINPNRSTGGRSQEAGTAVLWPGPGWRTDRQSISGCRYSSLALVSYPSYLQYDEISGKRKSCTGRAKACSATGTRTLVSCVKGKYANHLHHSGPTKKWHRCLYYLKRHFSRMDWVGDSILYPPNTMIVTLKDTCVLARNLKDVSS